MRIKPYSYPELPPATCQVCGGPRGNHTCTLVASYQDVGNNWRGVIRDRATRTVVAVCLGSYRNRDQGDSATNAARRVLGDMQRGGALAV
jgi:hypothetical protein